MSRCGDCVYYMEWVASPSMSGMCKIFKMIVSRDRKACFWFRRGKKRKKRKCGECAYYKGFFMYPEVLGKCEWFDMEVPYDQEACPEFKERKSRDRKK